MLYRNRSHKNKKKTSIGAFVGGFAALAAGVATVGIALEKKLRHDPASDFANNPIESSARRFPKQNDSLEYALQQTHPELNPKKAAKVVFVLAKNERDNIGPAEKFAIPGALGFRGTSVGPLQVKGSRGGVVFRDHWAQLKECNLFGTKGVAPSKEKIDALLSLGQQHDLAETLDLDGFGGIALGAIHFLDIYENFKEFGQSVSKQAQFQSECRELDEFLDQCGYTNINTSKEVIGRYTQTGNAPNALAPIGLSMVSYAASDTSPHVASIQGLLNDWIWITGAPDSKKVTVDGSYGEQTESLVNEFLTSMNRSPVRITILPNTTDPKVQSTQLATIRELQAALCSLWCSRIQGVSLEKIMQAKILQSINLAKDQEPTENPFKGLFDDQCRACYSISLVRALDTSLSLSPDSQSEESASKRAQVDSLYRAYLDTRNPNLFTLLEPDVYAQEIQPVCGLEYHEFLARFVREMLPIRLGENFIGALPTAYKELGVEGTQNPLGRGILGVYRMKGWREPGTAKKVLMNSRIPKLDEDMNKQMFGQ